MDWSTILDYALKIAGTALGTVLITLASILFAKLKTKIGEAKLNLFIEKVVKAAEQQFPNLGKKTGPEKFAYVMQVVKEKYPKLDEGYLKPLIEGAVYAVSEQVKQIAKEEKKEAAKVNDLTIG